MENKVTWVDEAFESILKRVESHISSLMKLWDSYLAISRKVKAVSCEIDTLVTRQRAALDTLQCKCDAHRDMFYRKTYVMRTTELFTKPVNDEVYIAPSSVYPDGTIMLRIVNKRTEQVNNVSEETFLDSFRHKEVTLLDAKTKKTVDKPLVPSLVFKKTAEKVRRFTLRMRELKDIHKKLCDGLSVINEELETSISAVCGLAKKYRVPVVLPCNCNGFIQLQGFSRDEENGILAPTFALQLDGVKKEPRSLFKERLRDEVLPIDEKLKDFLVSINPHVDIPVFKTGMSIKSVNVEDSKLILTFNTPKRCFVIVDIDDAARTHGEIHKYSDFKIAVALDEHNLYDEGKISLNLLLYGKKAIDSEITIWQLMATIREFNVTTNTVEAISHLF